MRIHSDTLSYADLSLAREQAIPDAWFATVTKHRSRKRAGAFEVRLEAEQVKGRRRANFGTRGGGFDQPFVPTYDEWGAFIARLYEVDGQAIVGPYQSIDHFHYITNGKYRQGASA